MCVCFPVQDFHLAGPEAKVAGVVPPEVVGYLYEIQRASVKGQPLEISASQAARTKPWPWVYV